MSKTDDILDEIVELRGSNAKIYAELLNTRKELQEVKELLKQISTQTGKMDSHVDFVEKVYTTVKAPLTFICSAVNKASSGYIGDQSMNDLPQIEGLHSPE